ncbi:MAG: UDP-N-acetylmuramoyl-tripeptide--D-alanyl-D-alanine ligase, partial [Propionibacteriaceae bacterium]|nr:UDP-N-acetylmuramoyl-tripeptide--D-alanyl-D-alanine ligase [Propionibacteriaceae bacterium]
MTVAEVAAVLGAATIGVGEVGARVLDVVTDSRVVRPGSLFVALPGEHVDGHSFVAAALEQGAVAALTERPLPVSGLCLAVENAVAAMGRLARHLVD